SGDVHCSYTARARLHGVAAAAPAIVQLTMSPFRNPLEKSIQWANRALKTRPVRGLMRLLARTARVSDVAIDWDVDHGPWFDNGVMTVVIVGRQVRVDVDHAGVVDGRQVLRRTATVGLSRG
ncbi:MAG: alkaline phosphatase family protein, partial [Gordonia sp. (in: high G+C Gram-positive bacteria)]